MHTAWQDNKWYEIDLLPGEAIHLYLQDGSRREIRYDKKTRVTLRRIDRDDTAMTLAVLAGAVYMIKCTTCEGRGSVYAGNYRDQQILCPSCRGNAKWPYTLEEQVLDD